MLGKEIGDLLGLIGVKDIDSSELDEALEYLAVFLEHNPYNVRAQLSGIYGLIVAVDEDKYLTEKQKVALMATILWHIPPTMAHVGVKMGLIPAVSGGFGYWKSLTALPRVANALLYANIAYMLAPHVQYAIENQNPYDIVRITGGSGGAYKPPGSHHFAFRNPISGM